jgi:hypothetical protein
MRRAVAVAVVLSCLATAAGPVRAQEKAAPSAPAALLPAPPAPGAVDLAATYGAYPQRWLDYESALRLRSSGVVLTTLAVTHLIAGAAVIAVDKSGACSGDGCGIGTLIGAIVMGFGAAYAIPGGVLWGVGESKLAAGRPADYPVAELVSYGKALRLGGIITASVGAALMIIGGGLISRGTSESAGEIGFWILAIPGPLMATIGIPLIVDGQLRINEGSRLPAGVSLGQAPPGSLGASLRLSF